MTVRHAAFDLPSHPEGSVPWQPPAPFQGTLEEYDYVEEEWFATGEVSGLPYTTPVMVRRPRDVAAFSGTVIVEPVHFFTVLPIWMYTSRYVMRSGHAWAYVASYKSAVDGFIKPSDPERYRTLHIEAAPEELSDFDLVNLPMDPADGPPWWEALHRQNPRTQAILAQVGAAFAASTGPFDGWDVGHVLLTGHSGTGDVTTNYIRESHDRLRRDDGSPVFDGYFPSGWTTTAFGPCDVPIVQVVTQGDVTYSDAFYRDGHKGFGYRRLDSDDPKKRYRLYEFAGFGHTSTQYPPTNDYTFLDQLQPGQMPRNVEMSSLPFNQVFHVALDHLVRWVSEDVAPPRGKRMELGGDGWFATDEHGNTRGGIRCADIDVPRARYISNPPDPEGVPGFGSFGYEQAFDDAELGRLYRDPDDYVNRYNRRLDELITEGWFLAADAEEFRARARAASVDVTPSP